jgi:ABC-type transport system substrate-binding protein
MLEEARTIPDAGQRLALYAEIEEHLVQEAPAAFVSHDLSAVLVKPYVQGYELTPIGVPQWHTLSLSR